MRRAVCKDVSETARRNGRKSRGPASAARLGLGLTATSAVAVEALGESGAVLAARLAELRGLVGAGDQLGAALADGLGMALVCGGRIAQIERQLLDGLVLGRDAEGLAGGELGARLHGDRDARETLALLQRYRVQAAGLAEKQLRLIRAWRHDRQELAAEAGSAAARPAGGALELPPAERAGRGAAGGVAVAQGEAAWAISPGAARVTKGPSEARDEAEQTLAGGMRGPAERGCGAATDGTARASAGGGTAGGAAAISPGAARVTKGPGERGCGAAGEPAEEPRARPGQHPDRPAAAPDGAARRARAPGREAGPARAAIVPIDHRRAAQSPLGRLAALGAPFGIAPDGEGGWHGRDRRPALPGRLVRLVEAPGGPVMFLDFHPWFSTPRLAAFLAGLDEAETLRLNRNALELGCDYLWDPRRRICQFYRGRLEPRLPPQQRPPEQEPDHQPLPQDPQALRQLLEHVLDRCRPKDADQLALADALCAAHLPHWPPGPLAAQTIAQILKEPLTPRQLEWLASRDLLHHARRRTAPYQRLRLTLDGAWADDHRR